MTSEPTPDDAWQGPTLEAWLKRISYWPTPWIGAPDTRDRRVAEYIAHIEHEEAHDKR